MVISKNAKRLMAYLLTFAFVLAGFAFTPKAAGAANDADAAVPSVKVLGATLRIDNVNGTQSLRLGIEVSNASRAKDCGIIIEANGKTVTVATDVANDIANGTKKHTDMYSVDVEGDKVIYSAVITGIPVSSFDKVFDVQGYVKAIDTVEVGEDEKYADSGEPVEKSVSGVVAALQKKDPTVKLDETGALVREKADGTIEKLTNDDMIFSEDEPPVEPTDTPAPTEPPVEPTDTPAPSEPPVEPTEPPVEPTDTPAPTEPPV
ncbi:MAG: hypothetical protein HFH14_11145, partial [Lachnospiraceae bacterium]|nr:hypothetical protein [Lachnospiraceae bacterium]